MYAAKLPQANAVTGMGPIVHLYHIHTGILDDVHVPAYRR